MGSATKSSVSPYEGSPFTPFTAYTSFDNNNGFSPLRIKSSRSISRAKPIGEAGKAFKNSMEPASAAKCFEARTEDNSISNTSCKTSLERDTSRCIAVAAMDSQRVSQSEVSDLIQVNQAQQNLGTYTSYANLFDDQKGFCGAMRGTFSLHEQDEKVYARFGNILDALEVAPELQKFKGRYSVWFVSPQEFAQV